MSKLDWTSIFVDAIWENFSDWRTRLEFGLPFTLGSYNLVLGFMTTLSVATLLLGVGVGVLGCIEKGISIYKSIKELNQKK